MRVKFTDLDVYRHMNNGRYFTNMDLGRWDFIARTGLLRAFARERFRPLMAGGTIRYRRSLDPFVRYELHTRIAGLDDRWTFFEQRFELDGQLAALAYAKVAIRHRGKLMDAINVFEICGLGIPKSALPDAVRAWQASELG
jgi:acyl-CoA thioesterase FadM